MDEVGGRGRIGRGKDLLPSVEEVVLRTGKESTNEHNA
jgi:hypothetical protein